MKVEYSRALLLPTMQMVSRQIAIVMRFPPSDIFLCIRYEDPRIFGIPLRQPVNIIRHDYVKLTPPTTMAPLGVDRKLLILSFFPSRYLFLPYPCIVGLQQWTNGNGCTEFG